jgi:hypothetical protein
MALEYPVKGHEFEVVLVRANSKVSNPRKRGVERFGIRHKNAGG